MSAITVPVMVREGLRVYRKARKRRRENNNEATRGEENAAALNLAADVSAWLEREGA